MPLGLGPLHTALNVLIVPPMFRVSLLLAHSIVDGAKLPAWHRNHDVWLPIHAHLLLRIAVETVVTAIDLGTPFRTAAMLVGEGGVGVTEDLIPSHPYRLPEE